MSDFENRIKFLMAGKLEKHLAEEYKLSEATVREAIKEMSFAEYMKLLEASADFGNQTTGTSSAGATNLAIRQPNTKVDDPFNPDGTLNTSRDTTGVDAQIDLDGAMHEVTVGNRYGNDIEVTTAKGQKMRVPAKDVRNREKGKASTGFSAADKALNVKDTVLGLAGKFKQGFNKGQQLTSSEEHDELNRLRELAGIEETCSAGATGAGSIVSGPSIVGNTAHTPTDQLRARLRRKKEKKK